MKKKVLYWVVFIASFIIARYAVGLLFRSDNLNFNLVQTSSQINQGLPKQIDGETRLDSTSAFQNEFIYKYTLINYTKDDLDIDKTKNTILPTIMNGVCTSPDLKIFRDHRVLMKYTYYDKNGNFLFDITADTSSCK